RSGHVDADSPRPRARQGVPLWSWRGRDSRRLSAEPGPISSRRSAALLRRARITFLPELESLPLPRRALGRAPGLLPPFSVERSSGSRALPDPPSAAAGGHRSPVRSQEAGGRALPPNGDASL